jgi:hypothetical protein
MSNTSYSTKHAPWPDRRCDYNWDHHEQRNVGDLNAAYTADRITDPSVVITLYKR